MQKYIIQVYAVNSYLKLKNAKMIPEETCGAQNKQRPYHLHLAIQYRWAAEPWAMVRAFVVVCFFFFPRKCLRLDNIPISIFSQIHWHVATHVGTTFCYLGYKNDTWLLFISNCLQWKQT